MEIAYLHPASYYKWRATRAQRTERREEDQDIKEHMMGIHFLHPEFGCPRMTTLLNESGYTVNHNVTAKLK